jgi:hypothetical protein
MVSRIDKHNSTMYRQFNRKYTILPIIFGDGLFVLNVSLQTCGPFHDASVKKIGCR